MSSKSILALSSSRVGNEPYLATASRLINNFLGNKTSLHIAFIPFALVNKTYDGYLENVQSGLSALSHTISLVDQNEPQKALDNCDVIMVGGGNTFKLLHDIYQSNLLDLIRNKVDSGIPYIGWSAGANITAPTIGTTNDMPITQPKSFNALGLFPFQVNPHYYNQKPEGFNGETRNQRLTEFMLQNPGIDIIGLPEGTALQLNGNSLSFIGSGNGILFQGEVAGDTPSTKDIAPGEDLSYLL